MVPCCLAWPRPHGRADVFAGAGFRERRTGRTRGLCDHGANFVETEVYFCWRVSRTSWRLQSLKLLVERRCICLCERRLLWGSNGLRSAEELVKSNYAAQQHDRAENSPFRYLHGSSSQDSEENTMVTENGKISE